MMTYGEDIAPPKMKKQPIVQQKEEQYIDRFEECKLFSKRNAIFLQNG